MQLPFLKHYAPVMLVGLLLLALFVLVGLGGYSDWNLKLFLTINRLGLLSDWLWQNLTLLGEGLVAFVLVAMVARQNGRLIWLALLAALIAGLAAQGFKHLFDMPRPGAVLSSDSFVVLGGLLKSHAFPSGHATTAWVAATLLAYAWPRWRYAVYAAALIVALSRVAVGAHWPLDILAGACLGYLCGWLAIRMAGWIGPAERNWHSWTAWLVLLLCSSWLVVYETDYPRSLPLMLLLAALGIVVAFWRLWRELKGRRRAAA